MANEISKLKVPVLGAQNQITMTTYDIKDATARTDAAAALNTAQQALDAAQSALGGGISVTTPVASLDAIANPQSNTIYLVGQGGEGSNAYEQYMYINGKFEQIGSTGIDLSDYKPTGSNAASNVSITPNTTSVYSMTSEGSVSNGQAASFNASVEGETLSLNFVANTPTVVVLPGRSQVSGLWNGYSAATAAAQEFTGSGLINK